VPLSDVAAQVRTAKALCDGAPLYVLGPIVTDVAPGHDHVTAAIGGAAAAAAGADYLCYVTPSEHLGLPGPDEVRAGVVAARIAAHAGDVAKGLVGARDWDDRMSRCRRRLDWEGMEHEALDPREVARYRTSGLSQAGPACTMCGEFCVYRLDEEER
jgi:phosphomethylpyrimidine synthase